MTWLGNLGLLWVLVSYFSNRPSFNIDPLRITFFNLFQRDIFQGSRIRCTEFLNYIAIFGTLIEQTSIKREKEENKHMFQLVF